MAIVNAQVARPENVQATASLADLILSQKISSEISSTNPWPGLDEYDEASRNFFHGRDAEKAELLRLIRLAPLTVLYGSSGLGKSSLLKAGVMPELRKEHFLPVYLRVDYSANAERPPLEQVMRRVEEEMLHAGADFPPRDEGETCGATCTARNWKSGATTASCLRPCLCSISSRNSSPRVATAPTASSTCSMVLQI